MALTDQQRSAKAAQKRLAMNEVELRHSVRCGIKQMLDDLMRWNEISETGESLQLLILNANTETALTYANGDTPSGAPCLIRHYVRPGVLDRLNEVAVSLHGASQKHAIELLILCAHAAGPIGSAEYLRIPRHEIRFSKNVAQAFEIESMRALRKDPGDEIIEPK